MGDDSGSMSFSSLPEGKGGPSRWDELQDTVRLIIELGSCFDASGVDIFFLHDSPKGGGRVCNVTRPDQTEIVQAFAKGLHWGTPLTETLKKVVTLCGAEEKPALMFILTDGEPLGGPAPFCQLLKKVVNQECTRRKIRFQIMACTGDEKAVSWLDTVDEQFSEVDVTDDYHSEKAQVLKAGKVKKFTRGDWLIKAMLGPISKKFDAWDEKAMGGNPASACCGIM